jgi:type IV pilus assembly protein PilA
MLLQNIRARMAARLSGDREAGFTLIELLVVMLILGILAAIALPAFFNQRSKAGDSKAKENAHSAQVAIETYATEHNGSYENATIGALHTIEPTIPSAEPEAGKEGIKVVSPTKTGYTIESISSNGNAFKIVNTAGAMTFPCTTQATGGCPPHETGSTFGATEGDWSK